MRCRVKGEGERKPSEGSESGWGGGPGRAEPGANRERRRDTETGRLTADQVVRLTAEREYFELVFEQRYAAKRNENDSVSLSPGVTSLYNVQREDALTRGS